MFHVGNFIHYFEVIFSLLQKITLQNYCLELSSLEYLIYLTSIIFR